MTNPYSRDNPGNFANDPNRASKAGHRSGGKFEPGSERARSAGQKGGRTTSERYLGKARD
ncbi:MAG: general stress protein [Alphaproteobacteria bacterium]|nr:general stress protein [Alphaproteobacteria bacterium]